MTHEEKFQAMLDAGVHFGHLKRKWNPEMAPYIHGERKGIHVIDLNKTIAKLDEACAVARQMAKSGKKILFVATKKQAKEIVTEKAQSVNMPYITERWSGGMLTNFATVKKAIRKMSNIDKMKEDGTLSTLSKREQLQVSRQREKLEKNLGSIADMHKMPAALFIVDIHNEDIAVKEAKRLGLRTFAVVDTNSNPNEVDYAIPGNDDATKSIEVILEHFTAAIKEGLSEKKADTTKKEEAKKAAEAAEKAVIDAKAEAPVVETPAVEAPAKEAPASDAPATDESSK
jgi:small subunit ribosomal protein S2